MKKLFLVLAVSIMSCSLWAQTNFSVNPHPQKFEGKSSYKVNTKKADGDTTISWLKVDTVSNRYGTRSAATGSVFMELYAEDLINFRGTGKKIETIKQIQFYTDSTAFSKISQCKIVLMQGTNIATATEVYSQVVPMANLVNKWNYIDLDQPYTVNLGTRLYIGYSMQMTAEVFPFAVTRNTSPNQKQSWIYIDGGGIGNVAGSYHEFLIKATVSTTEAPANEIMLSSIEIPKYKVVGESLPIKGTIKNIGTAPVNSFKVSYEIDGQQSEVGEFSGLNIASYSTYTFTVPQPYPLTQAKVSNIIITTFNPNGSEDIASNNTQGGFLPVLPQAPVQRIVLHEGFTSSTCKPCVQGNKVLKSVLDVADPTKWACIKYQMNWPGYGDPYYTDEGGVRQNFYNVSSVPYLVVDGPGYMNSTSNYSISKFNQLAEVPAAATTTGNATIDDKTVAFSVSINPVLNIINPNVRFFAAIVEKKTTKNKGTNTETEFLYVMKKFMTSPYGDRIDSLTAGSPKTLRYSYTFNGNYRLPANATNPINNDTENSVENFDSLMVVYWVQDIATQWVYQAGKADAKDIGIHLAKKDQPAVMVFPNPAKDQFTIQSNIPFTKIALMNMTGKTVKEMQVNRSTEYKMDVANLAKGFYLLTIETLQGISTQKIQIQ